MEPIKKLLRTPSAFVLVIASLFTLIGVIIQTNSSQKIAELPFNATSTADAKLTQNASITIPKTPDKTPSASGKVTPIEHLPATVYVFDNSVQPALSPNKLEVITGSQDGLTYKLIYPIPNSSSNGAGIYFEFNPLLDISQYESISFSTSKSLNNEKMEIAMSGNGESNQIFLNDLTTNIETGIQVDETNYKISLEKNFTNVRLVQFLWFWFSPSNRAEVTMEYKVSNIQFQKP